MVREPLFRAVVVLATVPLGGAMAFPSSVAALPTPRFAADRVWRVILIGLGMAVTLVDAHWAPRPLSQHMVAHFALMSVVAPLLAWAWLQSTPVQRPAPISLAGATVLQIVLLWGWHVPAAMDAATFSVIVRIAIAGSLLAAALFFWIAIFSCQGADRWRAILALLVTGKVYCLLAVILVFAPRPIFSVACYGAAAGTGALADQQLAGLLMIAACPIVYVATGVLIAGRWITELSERAVNGEPR